MVALRDVKSDFFEFDEQNYLIRGRRSGKVYRLGDPVKIRVKAANLEQRLLDYELVDPRTEGSAAQASGKGSRRGKGNAGASAPAGSGNDSDNGNSKPFYAAVAHPDDQPKRKSNKDKGRPRKQFGPKFSKAERKRHK